MMKWRIVVTDSESDTGVAPVCTGEPHGGHEHDLAVLDCCPEPHIECWTFSAATRVAAALNDADAELCS